MAKLSLAKRRDERIFFICGLCFLVVVVGFIIRERKRSEQKLKAEFQLRLSDLEITALRAQMNPHFIFNCLNSINRYILKSDAATASGYLTKFSKLIRFILDNSAATSIPLEIERQMLLLYSEMESLRFSNRFTYVIEVEESLRPDTMFIPPMLVQPYVENAIWHGLMNRKEAGHLSIRFSSGGTGLLQAVIEDNGVGRERAGELKSKNPTKEKSHGMRITGDRLRIVNEQRSSNASIKVEDVLDGAGSISGTRVTLKIPFTNYLDDAHNFSLS